MQDRSNGFSPTPSADEEEISLKPGDTIGPTHTCFDDALEYLTFQAQHHLARALRTLTLVHAVCRVPEDHPKAGERFAHAWVEERKPTGDVVWQAGIIPSGQKVYYARERSSFYAFFRVEDATRYTPAQAARENERTLSYGPWVERYKALCRDAADRAEPLNIEITEKARGR